MRKYRTSQKIWAVVLTLVLVLGMLPVSAIAVSADSVVRQADPSTMNEYQELFLDPDTIGVELSTENAGGIWTDKSVFSAGNLPAELTGATSEENTQISVTDTGDNFLVALSAIASNKEIVGYSTRPTDTMLVLDLSGSMQGSTSAMVTAANKAIGDLLALNAHNRVGVVLYSGNSSFGNSGTNTATVLMPLGRYTTTSYTGTGTNRVPAYIQSNNEQVSVANGVRPNTDLGSSKNTTGGTYTQNGIYKAMNELVNADEKVIPEGSLQAGTTRLPILVLMTDGQPTAGTKNYTNVGTSDVGEGRENTNYADDIAFLTQLTMAYAKREIETAYGTTSRLYTLGYNVVNSNYAQSVMDPSQYSTNRINTLWNTFMNTAAGRTFTINAMQNQNKTVTKHTDAAGKYTKLVEDYRYYTDEYFPADRSSELADAFQSIVDEIVLQSKYYPTYVEKDHDHDGYVTFTDKIGPYMEVTDVHGIVIGDTLFSGALLARGFEDGSIFGTVDNPSDLGDNLVWSVQERLGIDDVTVARALLQNAYDYGQLSYTSDTEFSNYIGWYSDANGNYLDFWHEGSTAAAPEGATHIIKSYGMLGATDTAHGISAADMMYASIRVSTELDDYDNDGIAGETMVTWRIPASLVPTITYQVQVTTNAAGEITGVESVALENENVKPIRLLYEVALQDDIHEWNITEKVADAYRDSTSNKDAGYVFYTNQWKKESGTTDTTRNTYSHFEPSVQNEWYYYTDDAIIYTDENGTEYTGSTAPSTSGTYYRAYQVYEKLETGTYRMNTHYEQISAQSLAMAEQSGSNWVIPKGTVFRFWDPFQYEKSDNTTDTHTYSEYPMVVHDDSNGHYYAYDVLGNNGKLTVTPATGIKVTKTIGEYVSGASDTFTFVISGGSGTATLIRLDENGDEDSRETLTFADGNAEFTISDKETVYIIGLTGGTAYTVSEKGNDTYKVSAVTVNGTAVAGKAAQITAVDQTIASAAFVNSPKTVGGLYITKNVTSDTSFPADAQFDVTVALEGNEKTDFVITATDMTNPGGAPITLTDYTYADGVITGLKIQHGQTIYINGLSEGTVATVIEPGTAAGFSLVGYTSINHTGLTPENDNVVEIFGDMNATVLITNAYQPAAVPVNISFNGIKLFDAEKMTEDAEFTFRLQEYQGGAWVDVDTDGVTVSAGTANAVENFTFEALNLTFDAPGIYSYQILEDIGTNADITYDRSVYTFSVIVTDNGDGTLQADVEAYVESGDEANFGVTGSDGSWAIKTAFNNEYHTTATSIDIHKTIVDNADSGKTGQGFVIETYQASVDADGVWTEESFIRSAVTDAEGEVRLVRNYDNTDFLADLDNDNVVTYHFIVKEKNTGEAGWSYDPTHYLMTVVLTRTVGGDGTESITADFSIVKGVEGEGHTFTAGEAVVVEGNSGSLTFENAYTPDEAEVDLDIVPTVVKHLEGRMLNAGEFTFAVFQDGQASHTSTEGAILVGTNDASGNVSFDDVLTFDKVGTYHYDVVEITGSLGGVTYDTTIYDMVVEVVDNGGTLEATYYFEDAVTNQVAFDNSYDAADTEHAISGTKQLTGRPLVNAEFRFTLTEVTDATGATVKEGGVTRTAESDPDNDNDGITQFVFPEIQYTTTGEYYYLIAEQNAGTTQMGVTYSTAKYVVKVTVTDNGAGSLVATSQIVSGGDALNFVNTYVPQGTSADLSSSKQLTGRVMAEGEFDFTLTEKTDSTYTTDKVGGVKETVKNGADGKITFSTLTFDTVGDYYYVVEEAAGSAGGVTYDGTKYYVHISVTDNHRGQLVAATSMVKVTTADGQTTQEPVSSIVFHNLYTVDGDGELTLGGTKVYNQTLTGGEFTFGLLDGDGNLLETVTNDADGNFTFSKLTYDESDVGSTYTYLVKEILPVVNGTEVSIYQGITYDTTVYTVQVTVSDNGVGGITISHTVNGAATPIVFTNNYDITGHDTVSLSGTKTMTGDRTAVSAGEFEFGLYEGSTLVEKVAVKADGTFDFSELTFDKDDIGKDIVYTVKEILPATNPMNGITYDTTVYTVQVTVSDNGVGGVDASYTINGSAHNAIAFTNTYEAAPVDYTLEGTKTYTKPLKGDDFTFWLQGQIGELTVDQTVKNDADGKIVFEKLTFPEAGIYTFTVTEIDKVLGFINYSKEVYTVKITVRDNGIGQLHVTNVAVTDSEGNAASGILFENTYVLDGEAKITLYGTKSLSGYRTQLQDQEFAFGLYDSYGNLLQTVYNDTLGNFVFNTLVFDETDVGQEISYTVKEILPVVNGAEVTEHEGRTYDTTVYTVDVTVVDNGEGGIEVSYTVNGVAGTPIAFANTYEAAPAEVQLEALKSYNRPLKGDDFTFTLTGEGQDQTKKNDASGKVIFDKLTFTEAGVYTYTVKEIDKLLGFIDYSKAVYEVTITVTDDHKGNLVAAVTVDGDAAGKIEFVNKYVLKGEDSIVLEGTKVYNQTLKGEDFTFELLDGEGNVLQTVKNGADGKFAFEALNYTEADAGKTYTYYVEEVLPVDEHGNELSIYQGITYDTTVYTVEVTVSDNGEGGIEATYTVNGGNDPIVFTNRYDITEHDEVTLTGTKVMTGDRTTVAAGEFTFGLYHADGTPVLDVNGNHIQAVTDAAGNFTFPVLGYNANHLGAHKYLVKEIIPAATNGITYDTTVYEVEIHVVDNGHGGVDVSHTVDGSAHNTLTFTNTYEAAPTEHTLEAVKIYEKGLKGEDFTFELSGEGVSQTKTNDASGKIVFDKLTFTEAKTYTFTVTETDKLLGFIEYSKEVYTVDVVVVDNGKGNLVIHDVVITNSTGTESDTIEFVNTYVLSGEGKVLLTGTKNLTGDRTAVKANEFAFGLYDSTNTLVEKVYNKADGTFSFTELTFDETHIGKDITYTVKEIWDADVNNGITYDSAVYTVKVTVVDNNEGGVTVTYTVNGGNDPIVFTNKYESSDVKVQLEGTKIYDKPLKGEDFTFELSGNGVSQTKKNDAEGKILFDELTFTEAGVYTYTVKEIDKLLGFIDYSKAEYQVTITVTDNEQGKLEAAVTVNGDAAGKIEFVNTYVLDGEDIVILRGTKLYNLPLAGTGFQFGLYDNAGSLLQTATADTDGSIAFAPLHFDETHVGKSYTYVVEEILPVDEHGHELNVHYGVHYDTTVYTVQVTVTDNGVGGVSASYTVNGSDTPIVFNNVYTVTGNDNLHLEGVKYLTGDRTDLLEGETYTFGLYDADGELVETATSDADGKFAFQNIHFDADDIAGAPYTYTVKEIAPAAGEPTNGVTYDTTVYTVEIYVVDNGMGGVEVSHAIKGCSHGHLEFTNTYEAADVKVQLEGTKIYDKPLKGEDFTFELSGNGVSQTKKNDAEGKILFDELTFTEAGVYTYTVKETDKLLGFIDYSKAVYEVTITVTDDHKGNLVAAVTVDGDAAGKIEFVNTYILDGEDSVVLEGTKVYNQTLKGEDFTFELLDGEGNVLQTVKNGADGKFVFSALEYTEADAGKTFTYIVEEVLPIDEHGHELSIYQGITYDATAYTVVVTVSDNGVGGIEATYTVNGGENELVFTNRYDITEHDEVTLTGTKTLTGDRTTVAAGEFTFGLYHADGTPVLDVNGNHIQAVTDAAGNFAFPVLGYNANHLGAHKYLVKEIIPAATNGITYDTTVYEVEIHVVDNGHGGVDASYTVNGSAHNTLTFTNTYEAADVKVQLEGVKKYDKPLKGEDFTFELSGNGVSQTKKNDAEGKILFDELTFTEAGVYTYTVKEIDQLLGFIDYSKAVYEVTVTVTDNGMGKLVAVVAVNGEADGKIEFVNTYILDGEASVILDGTKVLTGDRTELTAGEFSFGLYDAEGKLLQTVTNDAEGKFVFSALVFDETQVGKHTYTVAELAGSDPCMTYDDTVYTAEVIVTDNGTGGVEAACTVSGGQILFTNVYTEPDPVQVQIHVLKNVINKSEPGISPEGFEFVLTCGDESVTDISDADGNAGFNVKFSLAHVGHSFEFTVTETKGRETGVTYDDIVHTITVEVVQNADGTLKTLINGEEAQEVTVEFTNTYEAPSTPVTGDSFSLTLAVTMMILSMAGIAMILLTKKQKGGKYAR